MSKICFVTRVGHQVSKKKNTLTPTPILKIKILVFTDTA